jgi:type II secretory pathway pseudopilin PulG
MISKELNKKGFTLIETILYVAIMGIAISSFIAFGMSISASRSKTYVVQEVQANARLLTDVMSKSLKHARGVVSPMAGESNSLLVLDMPESEPDMTFSIIDGIVFLTDGVGEPTALVSSRVEVTDLQFSNIAQAGGQDSVLFEFGIKYRYDNSPDFSYTDSFRSAVTLRY